MVGKYTKEFKQEVTVSIRTEHFTLHRVAAGVYAAIANDTGAAFSNAGLIDLGEWTLAFDAFETPQAAAELIAIDHAHTDGDCVLRLPQDRVAYIGDIGMFQSQPFIPYGYPAEWVSWLDDMARWDIDVFVPGHGPKGGKTDLALEAAYIRALEDLVHAALEAGESVEEALRRRLPPPFDSWQLFGQRFEANVRASFKRQAMV